MERPYHSENQDRPIKAEEKLAYAANSIFKLNIEPNIVSTWGITLRSMRMIDNFVDNQTNLEERSAFAKASIDYLIDTNTAPPSTDSALNSSIVELKDSLDSFPIQIRRKFISALKITYKSTELVKAAQNAKQLAIATRVEGQVVAHLLTSLFSDEDLTKSNYIEFRKWICHLGRFGNLIDTLIDFQSDFDDGITKVNPTFLNRVGLSIQLWPDLFPVILRTNPQLLFNLGHTVVKSYKKR